MSDSISRWAVSGGDSLIWRDWDDGSAVYDERSGQTHIFDLMARLAVLELTEASGTVRDLAERVAEMTGQAPDAEMRNQLHTLLGELKDLGIVEVIAA